MTKMIRILREYKEVLVQMINLDKSLFYLLEKISNGICNQIKRITGIAQGFFRFTYLGCLVFYRIKNENHFEELIKKVMKILSLWQSKLL